MFWFNFHKINWGDVKLLSHKAPLKVPCRYLEPYRSYGEYPGGGGGGGNLYPLLVVRWLTNSG